LRFSEKLTESAVASGGVRST